MRPKDLLLRDERGGLEAGLAEEAGEADGVAVREGFVHVDEDVRLGGGARGGGEGVAERRRALGRGEVPGDAVEEDLGGDRRAGAGGPSAAIVPSGAGTGADLIVDF